MKDNLEKIVQRIDELKERYKSKESKHKLLLGIAVFILSPCAFILKLNGNDVVKIILSLIVTLIMLDVILLTSPILLLYHIWCRSSLKTFGKLFVTSLLALFFVVCYVGATQETDTETNSTTSYSEETKEPVTESKHTEKQTELITEKTTEKTTKVTTFKTPTTNTPTEPVTEFKWKSAIGNLYNGVELYIVTEDKSSLYGVVTEYDTKAHRVQVYLAEGDAFMWFPTREISFLNKLKVRSDDPHLPENQ